MTLTTETYTLAETVPSLSVGDYHSLAVDMRTHLETEVTGRGYVYDSTFQNDRFEVPLDLSEGLTVLESLAQAGESPILLDGLQDPDMVHTSLDFYLEVEKIVRLNPKLNHELAPVTTQLDTYMDSALYPIVTGGDQLASVKALRLICSRYAASGIRGGSDGGTHAGTYAVLQNVIPNLVALRSISGSAAAEARKLDDDLMDALAAQSQSVHGRGHDQSTTLFDGVMGVLGFNGRHLYEAWQDGKQDAHKDRWVRANIKRMFELERMEPGLCGRLFQTFRTQNFARHTAWTHRTMYRMRQEHPEMPYVMGFMSQEDPNDVFDEPQAGEKLVKELLAKGVRYEEHECAMAGDVTDACQGASDLNKAHGAEVVDFIIRGHGDWSGVKLGRHGRGMLEGDAYAFYVLKPALRPNARGILDSCSTGDEAAGQRHGELSAAARLTRVIGRTVVAPNKPIDSSLKVVEVDGEPRLDIDYFLEPESMLLRYVAARISKIFGRSNRFSRDPHRREFVPNADKVAA